jgi:hypothetical protein
MEGERRKGEADDEPQDPDRHQSWIELPMMPPKMVPDT